MIPPLFAGRFVPQIKISDGVKARIGDNPEKLQDVELDAFYWMERTLSNRHLNDEKSETPLFKSAYDPGWSFVSQKDPNDPTWNWDDIRVLVDDQPVDALVEKNMDGNDATNLRRDLESLRFPSRKQYGDSAEYDAALEEVWAQESAIFEKYTSNPTPVSIEVTEAAPTPGGGRFAVRDFRLTDPWTGNVKSLKRHADTEQV